ncbi:MAG: hypothetical protein Cons2KO_15050 [Congregibacter sp.]
MESCFPYIDSCTSISATGRHPPASFVFKGGMLVSAGLIAVFWWMHAHCLRSIGIAGAKPAVMQWLGWLAVVGLILYVTVLGEVGDWWRTQRRIGTILFFSFTFLAQLLLASMFRQSGEQLGAIGEITGRRMLRIAQLMLAIGLISVGIQAVDDTLHDRVEDAVEWQLALLLQINFLLCALFWRRTHWRLIL